MLKINLFVSYEVATFIKSKFSFQLVYFLIMQQALRYLTEEETKELYLVPIWISILIAGADNNIDKLEIRKAIEIINEKQQKENALIVEYYRMASNKFEINLKGYLALMPTDKEKRIDFLIKKIGRVNYYFSKLGKDFAYQLYLSFRDFANQIAHASGGFFGLLSVSYAESKFVDLKMIDDPSQSTFETNMKI